MLRRLTQILSSKLGYKITRVHKDLGQGFEKIYRSAKDYTMTSRERMHSLYRAVQYIAETGVPGDLVECGVWKGGSAMIMAHVLKNLGQTDRKIYLYDTFSGMTEPSGKDKSIHTGDLAQSFWHDRWLFASLEEARKNILLTGYPEQNLVFVKGKVEDTIPAVIPSSIALLRLDTDWYSSTYHEFRHLFPLLTKGGVLIVDDYGYWTGSKEATDQYFKENQVKMLLNYIDPAGVIGIKVD